MRLLTPPYRRMPWKNGLGSTLEIATSEGAGDWTWRVSMADMPSRAAFSSFPGITRHIACLHGEGLVLHRDGETTALTRESSAVTFEGEESVEGEPIGAGVIDINLMHQRSEWSGSLRVMRGARRAARCESDITIVHVVECGEPLCVINCSSNERVQVERGGTLIVAGTVEVLPSDHDCAVVLALLRSPPTSA